MVLKYFWGSLEVILCFCFPELSYFRNSCWIPSRRCLYPTCIKYVNLRLTPNSGTSLNFLKGSEQKHMNLFNCSRPNSGTSLNFLSLGVSMNLLNFFTTHSGTSLNLLRGIQPKPYPRERAICHLHPKVGDVLQPPKEMAIRGQN